MSIHIVLPHRDTDELSESLRDLTEVLCKRFGHCGNGGLGGSYGYGVNHETAEFAMHRFCWCEKQRECPWCAGCDCEPTCTGLCALKMPPQEWIEKHGFVVDWGAPNFWHKPTGMKVWWYKYIGRDMRVLHPQAETGNAPQIVRAIVEAYK